MAKTVNFNVKYQAVDELAHTLERMDDALGVVLDEFAPPIEYLEEAELVDVTPARPPQRDILVVAPTVGMVRIACDRARIDMGRTTSVVASLGAGDIMRANGMLPSRVLIVSPDRLPPDMVEIALSRAARAGATVTWFPRT